MHRHRHTAAVPRERAFWIAASVLLVGQLLAFWMVCSNQVRMSEQRHASAQAERLAVAECLRTVPNSTIGACATRAGRPENQVAADGQPPRDEGATPVNYVYH